MPIESTTLSLSQYGLGPSLYNKQLLLIWMFEGRNSILKGVLEWLAPTLTINSMGSRFWHVVSLDWAFLQQISLDPIKLVSGNFCGQNFCGQMNTSDCLSHSLRHSSEGLWGPYQYRDGKSTVKVCCY